MSTMTTQPEASADTTVARRAMIDSQLRTSGVNEEYVLARMIAVPRENYLPPDKASLAYIDRSIPLGKDAHLASPLFYGKLMIEADPRPDDRVLIIEGGTGYLGDLLRPLVAEVNTISVAEAADAAGALGKSCSLMLVDGAIEQLPAHLADCIEEGGRIVSGLLLRQVTRLASGRKVANTIALQPVEDLGIPVLHAFDKPAGWTF